MFTVRRTSVNRFTILGIKYRNPERCLRNNFQEQGKNLEECCKIQEWIPNRLYNGITLPVKNSDFAQSTLKSSLFKLSLLC